MKPSGGSLSQIQFKFKFCNPNIYYRPHKTSGTRMGSEIKNAVDITTLCRYIQRNVSPNIQSDSLLLTTCRVLFLGPCIFNNEDKK